MRPLKLAILYAVVGLLCACTVTPAPLDQGPQFPQPSAGFVPQPLYPGSVNQAFTAVSQALAANQITVATAMPAQGQIVTDYIQGPSNARMVFLAATSQMVRYRYSIFITPAGRQSRVAVKATLESSGSFHGTHVSSDTPYHDVSSDNPALVTNLQNWLYEKIQPH